MGMRLSRPFFALSLAFVGWLSAIAGAQAQVSQVSIAVEGMTCPFCSFGVAKRLKKVAGVEGIHVDTDLGLATVSAAAGDSIDVLQVPGAVKSAGFAPGAVRIVAIGTLQSEEEQMYLHLKNQDQTLRLIASEVTNSNLITTEELLNLVQSGAEIEVTGTWSWADGDGLAEIQLEQVKTL